MRRHEHSDVVAPKTTTTGRAMTAVDAPQGGPLLVDVSATGSQPENASTNGSSPPKAPTPPGRKLASKTLLMIGLGVVCALAVWFLVYALVLTGLQEHGSQARLYDQYRLQLAAETAPLAEPVSTGSPVALLNSPAGHMHNIVVVEGTTSRLLAEGPGHLSNSPLPGQMGTSVLLGRSVTYGAPFRHLTGMQVGDKLTVTTGQGVFTYKVEDIRSSGSRLPPSLKSHQSRLTLVTSESGGWRGGWAPTETVYLDALLVHGQAQPVPSGVPSTVRKAALPMQDDPSAAVPLIFWLEALLVVGAAVVWSWVRWGRAQTWIVGLPVFLLVLWGTSNALMRFLPNLL